MRKCKKERERESVCVEKGGVVELLVFLLCSIEEETTQFHCLGRGRGTNKANKKETPKRKNVKESKGGGGDRQKKGNRFVCVCVCVWWLSKRSAGVDECARVCLRAFLFSLFKHFTLGRWWAWFSLQKD